MRSIYAIYIKSHCEYPDYEGECEAVSKKEAVQTFLHRVNVGNESEWGEKEIAKCVFKLK